MGQEGRLRWQLRRESEVWESWIVLLAPEPLISVDLAVLMECTEPFKWLRQAQLISTFCAGPKKVSDILKV